MSLLTARMLCSNKARAPAGTGPEGRVREVGIRVTNERQQVEDEEEMDKGRDGTVC